jgi:hypothetical protein
LHRAIVCQALISVFLFCSLILGTPTACLRAHAIGSIGKESEVVNLEVSLTSSVNYCGTAEGSNTRNTSHEHF